MAMSKEERAEYERLKSIAASLVGASILAPPRATSIPMEETKQQLRIAASRVGISAHELDELLGRRLAFDRIWDFIKIQETCRRSGRDAQTGSIQDYAERYLPTRAVHPRSTHEAQLDFSVPRFYRTVDALLVVAQGKAGYRLLKLRLREKTNPKLNERARALLADKRTGVVAEKFWFRGDTLMSKMMSGTRSVNLGRVLQTWSLGQSAESPRGQDSTPTIQLDWEVLPPDWMKHRFGGRDQQTEFGRVHQAQEERLELLKELQPGQWCAGLHLGQRLYYVALFPGLAIADSVDLGNALYYVHCDGNEWQGVFKASKREALAAGARRIVHAGDWRSRIVRLVTVARATTGGRSVSPPSRLATDA